ncbi:DNA mismatch repair endonuclease MutL [Anaerovorax odorimutans]|uniref:DNA mismatch repair protein MutL n=1 Tax=Anaerovorax odorimutans TaxID=109327 RepID=A0ABT1RLQ8_9FIRM|nr:DNA mismatch repair endonuclease MutL [Anaerovorax odorimutans]MCQ4635876.1 DNA mismatch repair endonuclease MutL [Anaerovorax odorimutans]
MIRILEKEVADKIAAGEVVDRPLSIVKELVENSIDAGASAITVEIKKGGKTYIRVTDDGSGIEADQVETAFLRHATSKISQARDLESIETLGFRGEALASISAVSRTEIITKPAAAAAGVRLVIEGSHPAEKEMTGCPDGTTIVVRDLFYNTPARQKFMKSDATESSLVIEFVSQIALAYANLKIRLISNGNLLFTTPGRGDRHKNILTVFSREISDDLIPVRAEKDYLSLEGYISGPGQSRATRKHQIFFINGRVVNSKILQKGISQAYSDKLFEGRFPVAFLFLRADPAVLDVNIHPNKREVRFNDEAFVTEFVHHALRQALLSRESIPEVKEKDLFRKEPEPAPEARKTAEAIPAPRPATVPPPAEEQVDIKKLLSTLRQEEEKKEPAIREEVASYQAKKQETGHQKEKPPAKEEPFIGGEKASKKTPRTPAPFDFDELTVTGSIFGTYITAIDETCFYLIDQHAAHERIFFEKLMDQYRNSEKHSQPIMLPIMLNVSYQVAEEHEDWVKALAQMGFSVEEFGPKTYIVKEIPMFMELAEAERFLNDFADSVSDGVKLDNIPAIEKLTMRSCKSAVKAHDYLKDSEIEQLIADLKNCENPFSCPHGRPTFIKMTQYEIEKMFKRV